MKHETSCPCIFVSHSWWQRDGEVQPDFTVGARKHLKHSIVCRGIRALIQRHDLDPHNLTIWMDWFSIDQLDPALKEAGVRSMITYVTRADYMLIPVATPQVVNADFSEGDDPDDFGAYYPEDVAVYGQRGWCRVEYFIFGLFSEIHVQPTASSELPPLRLFAVGSDGDLQQYKVVEFLGGDRGDMPSQGLFSFESDRQAILRLEEQMISCFGFAVVRNAIAVAAAADEDAPCTVDLGAKMLQDEHLQALAEAVRTGALAKATTLSFNANPYITTLPTLDGLPKLRTLSFINCAKLCSLPDLSSLPSLKVVKFEGCVSLKSLPQLPAGVELDESSVPDHLRATPTT